MGNGEWCIFVEPGAVYTALKLSGRSDKEARHSGNALRSGQWQIGELISRWREWVLSHDEWQRREYEGWYAVSCDVVVFPRLKLKGWQAKLYRGTFGRAVKAVGLGLVVEVGHYGEDRVPLLRQIVRCRNVADSEAQLQADLLQAGARALEERGVFVHDAGVSLKAVQQADIKRYDAASFSDRLLGQTTQTDAWTVASSVGAQRIAAKSRL